MDDFFLKIAAKIGPVKEFSWSKGYSVDCTDASSPYSFIDQRVWISTEEFLVIESINLENYKENEDNYYQNFLTEDNKIKKEAYALKIKFKKENIFFALSLCLIMLLCSEWENGDLSGAKIYI